MGTIPHYRGSLKKPLSAVLWSGCRLDGKDKTSPTDVPNNLTEGTSNWNSSLDDLVDDRKENSFLKESCLSFLTAPSSRGAIFGSVSGCQPSPPLGFSWHPDLKVQVQTQFGV